MGSLGDGIPQGISTGREMRTRPLWGLRYRAKYLHDARASTLEEAILAHEGQGRYSRDRYSGIQLVYRRLLGTFLKSL